MRLARAIGILTACAGSAAIEFGFLAPVLMMASFGVYEFGRWGWTIEALQEAASRGARCAAIKQASCSASGAFSSSSTVAFVQNVASTWGLTVPSADITANSSTSCGGVSGFSQVQISYVFGSVVTKLIPSGASGSTVAVSSCYPNTPSS
ncbi:MAG TPA: TadE family protein [Rhizomicrobium sp.]|jgi:Flp pilus assembly protein TadG